VDVAEELKRRIAERKAELMAIKEREMLEFPEIALYVAEFLAVLIGLMFGVAGKPEACCAMMLIAIYLKLRR
jgi:hypothetical protein